MLRISKLTDYGTVVLAHLAGRPGVVSAADVASSTGVAPPTVSKLLKALGRAGLVHSTRGASGGYELARAPRDISAAEIIDALEGPVSITECSSDESHCEHEDVCNVGGAWQRINVAIRRALDDVSLDDLLRSNSPVPTFRFAGLPVSVESTASKKN
ncbi:MAG: SUF system Fe-S cluster assembly regulator [Woeseiaceae bacterium]|nr:SUF system Fe-S cluster assembly regulator [Woeseiaceae bacterium]